MRGAVLVTATVCAALSPPVTKHSLPWRNGANACDVAYTRSGSVSSDAAIVFCPGFGAGAFHFDAVASLVAEGGHAAYAMDWFGQGDSWPEAAEAGASHGIEAWARQLADFLASDVLAGHAEVYVAGNSVGGLAATLAAARGARCDGLILLNATPFWSFWGPSGSPLWDGTLPAPAPLRAFAKVWFDTLRSPATVRRLLSQVYASPAACDAALAKQICAAASHPVGPDAFASILFSGASRIEYDDALTMAAASTPVGLCYGAEDPWVFPAWGQRAFRRAGSAAYYELSPAGHCPHHEAPAATAAVLRSLLDEWRAGGTRAPPEKITAVEADGRRIVATRVDGTPRGLLERGAALAWG